MWTAVSRLDCTGSAHMQAVLSLSYKTNNDSSSDAKQIHRRIYVLWHQGRKTCNADKDNNCLPIYIAGFCGQASRFVTSDLLPPPPPPQPGYIEGDKIQLWICFHQWGDLAQRKIIGTEHGSTEQLQLVAEQCLLFLHEHLFISGKSWVFLLRMVYSDI